jgi:protein gp37
MVSPGCTNCYAMTQAHRWPQFGKLTRPGPNGMVWTGEVRTIDALLNIPLSWRTPRLVFVNSQSDTFHAKVPTAFIDWMFAVMGICHWHVFQVLTKRADRMLDYCSSSETLGRVTAIAARLLTQVGEISIKSIDDGLPGFQLPNVWLGVSAEDEERADERIALLLKTPAAVRFVSCEPLLGPIDFNNLSDGPENLNALTGLRENPFGDVVERRIDKALDWVIVGGESGLRARSADLAWIRSIVDQCRRAHVPVFVKQIGAKPYETDPEDPGRRRPLYPKDRKGSNELEWSEDLRVRQFPEVSHHAEEPTKA